MHAVVKDNLEEYLSGLLECAQAREIEAHLSACDRCGQDVAAMRDVNLLFGSLKSEEAAELPARFYAGVMERVEAGRRQARPSFAGLLSLDFAFGRGLVLASLMTLVAAGAFLVTREAGDRGGVSPDAVMAQQNAPGFESGRAPDNMLVTLTAYEH